MVSSSPSCPVLDVSTTQPLHIALHAQAKSTNGGLVVGSEITCSGFKNAFESLNPLNVVKVFTPFEYDGIEKYQWDIVLIEGWFPSINSFIHEIRRLTKNHVKVYYYCLDPFFPGVNFKHAFGLLSV